MGKGLNLFAGIFCLTVAALDVAVFATTHAAFAGVYALFLIAMSVLNFLAYSVRRNG